MADSRLTPGLVVLDKGLNLQAPKISAPEGSVLDMLNYEQVDFQGQKRIDGYVRYDGKLGSYIDDYYILDNETGEEGDVYQDSDNRVVGVYVGTNALAIIDYNHLPAGQWGRNVDSAEDHYNNLLAYNNMLRYRTGSLPGPVAGLHWFNDRLYAISNLTRITLSGGAVEINMPLYDSYGALIGYTVSTQSSGSVNVVGVINLGESLYDADGNFIGDVSSVEQLSSASFFESRTELQALAEDGDAALAGWVPIHLGWVVNFKEGISLYGSLPSLNQNIQGLGVQGPTSISGDSGRPLELTQGVPIAGEPAQVNGWKSSNTPTTYTLNPNDLKDIDDVFTYADAFVSWNGSTGAVSAPGVTTSAIPQYSATNTVEVVVD